MVNNCNTIERGPRAEQPAKVFNPYFTIKPPGKGTGLGLSINYGIVNEYGGEIKAESPPGAGTKLNILLPVSTQEGGGNW
jgi:two-component system NtrC family sensor kinase